MNVVAETKAGRISGRERRGVVLFAGVPYAAPPVGSRRFRAPEPHGGWEGVRPAQSFGPVAVQVGDVLGAIGAAPAPQWSEDCLTLNVQTPALDDARRPVMVWIHGGAFVNGSGSTPWYDGTSFARNGDVVVVTINYRLGALGWLYLGHLDPAFATSGNCGLLDQVAALQWVHDNITSFGGDPDNVTVFGESAGAMSVGTLLGTPAAAGLFAKAIAQSGSAHNATGTDDAAAVTDAVVGELGGGGLEALLDAEAGQILAAQQAVSLAATRGAIPGRSTAASGLPFGPVVDGTVLPGHPLSAVRAGAAAGVALMLGTNRDEWKLFGLMAPPATDEATVLKRMARLVPDPGSMLEAYQAALPGADPDELFGAYMTDAVFRVPADRLAQAHSAHRPGATFLYRFDHESAAFDGRLGACHALEIPFVFDTLDQPGTELLTGPEPPRDLSAVMHRAWLAFARGAEPDHPGLERWPAFDAGRPTMIFGGGRGPAGLVHDPDTERRRAWDGLLEPGA